MYAVHTIHNIIVAVTLPNYWHANQHTRGQDNVNCTWRAAKIQSIVVIGQADI